MKRIFRAVALAAIPFMATTTVHAAQPTVELNVEAIGSALLGNAALAKSQPGAFVVDRALSHLQWSAGMDVDGELGRGAQEDAHTGDATALPYHRLVVHHYRGARRSQHTRKGVRAFVRAYVDVEDVNDIDAAEDVHDAVEDTATEARRLSLGTVFDRDLHHVYPTCNPFMSQRCITALRFANALRSRVPPAEAKLIRQPAISGDGSEYDDVLSSATEVYVLAASQMPADRRGSWFAPKERVLTYAYWVKADPRAVAALVDYDSLSNVDGGNMATQFLTVTIEDVRERFPSSLTFGRGSSKAMTVLNSASFHVGVNVNAKRGGFYIDAAAIAAVRDAAQHARTAGGATGNPYYDGEIIDEMATRKVGTNPLLMAGGFARDRVVDVGGFTRDRIYDVAGFTRDRVYNVGGFTRDRVMDAGRLVKGTVGVLGRLNPVGRRGDGGRRAVAIEWDDEDDEFLDLEP